MANLSLSFTITNGTTADATEVQTNYNDIVTYINNRNTATLDWDFVSSAGLITGKDGFRSSGGAVGSPAYSFTSDTNTGMFQPSADQVTLVAGGVNQFNMTSTEIRNAPAASISIGGDANPFSQAIMSSGSNSAPSYTFGSDGNTGMYRIGADNMGFTTGGTNKIAISTAAITPTIPIRGPAGAVGAPTYSFSTDTDTGIYSPGAGSIGFALNGAAHSFLTATAFRANTTNALDLGSSAIAWRQCFMADGSAASPSYIFSNDVDTGLYRPTTDQLAISLGGVRNTIFESTGTADATTYTPTVMYGGGDTSQNAIDFKTRTVTGVTTGATTIMNIDGPSSSEAAAMVLVYGNDSATNEFMDLILMRRENNAPPVAVQSYSTKGSPAVRTYTAPSVGTAAVALASGTYTIRAFAIAIQAR